MIYAKSSPDEIWWNLVRFDFDEILMRFDEIWWDSDEIWWDLMRFDEFLWVLIRFDEFLMSFDEFRLMSFWWVSENIIALTSKHDFKPIGPLMRFWWDLMRFDEFLMRFDEIWWVSDEFLMSFGWWVSDEFRETLLL